MVENFAIEFNDSARVAAAAQGTHVLFVRDVLSVNMCDTLLSLKCTLSNCVMTKFDTRTLMSPPLSLHPLYLRDRSG